ncbi:MAG TPA: PEGA domain-containing protein [Vicinamibacterales bacterium]|nr:PEGA domain-containing protein [Vicinamibacterales bacterium]
MSLPSEALAQRGGRGRAVVRPIVVAPFYYAPLYSPFFWDAYAWGQPGWYGPGLFNGGFADSAARIQVTPRHAEVYVDGYLAGVVDDFDGFAQRLRLPAGEHVIELYLEGYKVIAQKILFQPGHTIRIRHTMEPIAPGDPPPNRPRPDPNAPPPSQRGGYDALGRGVPPEARSTKDASALAIRVQPGDAIVLVDGERWQTSGGERLEIQVTPGEHRIEVQKDGYQSFATTVRVRSGETAPVNVSLTKS